MLVWCRNKQLVCNYFKKKKETFNLYSKIIWTGYRCLQQHSRIQADFQLDGSISARIQVTKTTHQVLTQIIDTATELHKHTYVK